MVKKKKNYGSVIFTVAIIGCLCFSVYLNWFFGNSEETGKVLGESQYVDNGTVTKTPTEEYFINARIDRKAAYDAAVSELNAVITSNADSESKAIATEKLAVLAFANGSQVKIERLVTAKGFRDCIAFCDENNTTVVVDADELTQTDVIAIKDIVIRTTEQPASKIQVTTVNLTETE